MLPCIDKVISIKEAVEAISNGSKSLRVIVLVAVATLAVAAALKMAVAVAAGGNNKEGWL